MAAPSCPASLTALKADPTVGDAVHTGIAWTTAEYVNLGDATKAHWDVTAWVAGVAP